MPLIWPPAGRIELAAPFCTVLEKKERPGGVDRALGKPTHGGDGSVRGQVITY